jgi:spore coat protein CotF
MKYIQARFKEHIEVVPKTNILNSKIDERLLNRKYHFEKTCEILKVTTIAVKTVIRTALRNTLYLIKEIAQLSNRSDMTSPLPKKKKT